MTLKRERRQPSPDDVRIGGSVSSAIYERLHAITRKRRVTMNLLLNEIIEAGLPEAEKAAGITN